MLTKELVQQALPKHLKSNATQQLVDTINNIVSDPLVAEQIRENYITYTSVLQDGKYKMEAYLSAVQYVTYKLMGLSNKDAYAKTFPQRYANLLSKGCSEKDISAYIAGYNKGQLVNKIMEQSLIPSWILNQDKYQLAINTQYDLMIDPSISAKVRCEAANSLLTHLGKPKESNFQVNIDARTNTGLSELTESLKELATMQLELIKNGKSTKDIAAHEICKKEGVIDVN